MAAFSHQVLLDTTLNPNVPQLILAECSRRTSVQIMNLSTMNTCNISVSKAFVNSGGAPLFPGVPFQPVTIRMYAGIDYGDIVKMAWYGVGNVCLLEIWEWWEDAKVEVREEDKTSLLIKQCRREADEVIRKRLKRVVAGVQIVPVTGVEETLGKFKNTACRNKLGRAINAKSV